MSKEDGSEWIGGWRGEDGAGGGVYNAQKDAHVRHVSILSNVWDNKRLTRRLHVAVANASKAHYPLQPNGWLRAIRGMENAFNLGVLLDSIQQYFDVSGLARPF